MNHVQKYLFADQICKFFNLFADASFVCINKLGQSPVRYQNISSDTV